MVGTSLHLFWPFHSRDDFCTLSRLFVGPGIRLFCDLLAAHYLAVYSILESSINDNGTVYNGCVSVRYSSLFTPLSPFTQQRVVSFWNFDTVLHILFGMFLAVETKWINLNSRKICKFNIRSFFDRVVFGVAAVAAGSAFCCLGSERLGVLPIGC